MAVTPNLGLYKPTRDDYINVSRDISQNMDKIDAAFGQALDTSEFGIVVTGNTANVNIVAGQYVIIRNSTISNVDDGLYIAKSAIPSGEAISESNLEAVSGGGLNAVNPRPNYESTNKVDIAGGNNVGSVNFTAPSNGTAFLHFGFRTDTWVYVKVNGNTVAILSGASTSLSWNNIQLFLRKGDVLTFDNGDAWYAFLTAGSYFIPNDN